MFVGTPNTEPVAMLDGPLGEALVPVVTKEVFVFEPPNTNTPHTPVAAHVNVVPS
jgi:hypothetical protein